MWIWSLFQINRNILFLFRQALADESEYVRDTGLKAGQKLINMFAETSIELLLPEVFIRNDACKPEETKCNSVWGVD